MTEEQLRELMRTQLAAFNDEGVAITDDTIHNQVLSSVDGYRNIKESSSKEIYHAVIRGAILRRAKKEGKKQKEADKSWGNWMGLSVRELAQKILPMVIFFLFSFQTFSQVNVNLSAVKTDLGNDAIKIAVTYLQQWDSMFKVRNIFVAGKNSYFQITPQFDIQTGTSDAFSSLQARITGSWLLFKETEIVGFETVDLSKTFWVIPVSLGTETDNTFRRVNGIFEVGFIPYWHTVTNKAPDWLKRIKPAVFLQAGYKFKRDTVGDVGGDVDESLELEDKNILRIKTGVDVNIIKPVSLSGLRIGIVGSADLWYDFLNGKTYDRLIGEFRFFLSGDTFMSLFYEHGSGAPNFNQGDQFGVGLSVNF